MGRFVRVVQRDGKGELVAGIGKVAAEVLDHREAVGGVGVGDLVRLGRAVRVDDVDLADLQAAVRRGGIGVDHPHHDVAGGGVLRQAGDAGSGLCEGEDVVARGGEVVAVKGERDCDGVDRAARKGGGKLGGFDLCGRAFDGSAGRPGGQVCDRADREGDAAVGHACAGGGGHVDGFCQLSGVIRGQHAGRCGTCQQGSHSDGSGKSAEFGAGNVGGLHRWFLSSNMDLCCFCWGCSRVYSPLRRRAARAVPSTCRCGMGP